MLVGWKWTDMVGVKIINGVSFRARLGMHMGRPTAAVIAEGGYVAMTVFKNGSLFSMLDVEGVPDGMVTWGFTPFKYDRRDDLIIPDAGYDEEKAPRVAT